MLALCPMSIQEARAFIAEHHRHHKPPVSGLFAVGVSDESRVRAVAVVGRPVARMLDDDFTAEVTRLCVDEDWHGAVLFGTAAGAWMRTREAGLCGMAHAERVLRMLDRSDPGACSMLYAAAWRAARALGYRRLVTYTLPEEGGASLRAAGWKLIGEAGGGSWSRKSRPRVDTHPMQSKFRWEAA